MLLAESGRSEGPNGQSSITKNIVIHIVQIPQENLNNLFLILKLNCAYIR